MHQKLTQKKISKIFWTALYIFVIGVANLTATQFFNIFATVQVSAGTILFGFVFTIRDRLHYFGKKYVYWSIFGAAIVSIFLVYSPLNQDIQNLTFRVVLASVIALIVSESVDTELFQKFIKKTWLKRVFYSNLTSVPVDSLLFNTIAFLGLFTPTMLTGIILGEILYKYTSSFILAVLINFKSQKIAKKQS